MAAILERPENAGALRYLAHGRSPAEAAFGPPAPDIDRGHLGTNPAVVSLLWDVLNGALPTDCRSLVFDGPALVHPDGVILAAAVGTQYALRLLPAAHADALMAGAEVVHEFRTVGTSLDLRATFGAEWVFGRRDEREADWLLETYRSIEAPERTGRPSSL